MPAKRPPRLTVLWATDGSAGAHAAIPVLRRLLLPAAARLVVLAVAPHAWLAPARPDPAFLTRATAKARRSAMAEAEDTARQDIAQLDPERLADIVTRWGNPIQQILSAARAELASIVVLGSKGHSNLGLILIGSVTQGVVQHATIPVLVARPGRRDPKTIIIGYHRSAAAKRGLDFLCNLALPKDARLHIASVVEPFTVPRGTPISYRRKAMEAAREVNESRHNEAQRELELAAADLAGAGLATSTHLLSGDAANELDALAKHLRADLMVVGSRKPSPSRHYLLGSTAEKLVRHASASVLVVR